MIAIIDYKAGNLRSVERALKHLGIPCVITAGPSDIMNAERVIFPGVGAAGKAMETIRELKIDMIINEVIARGTPFLGICLGTQIIFDSSEEDAAFCLGIISGTVRKFPDMGEKIPHMGWNTLETEDDPLFKGLSAQSWCYFVHSYYVPFSEFTIASTEYASMKFTASLKKDNFWGCQFHPEKSGPVGEQMLKNFLEGV